MGCDGFYRLQLFLVCHGGINNLPPVSKEITPQVKGAVNPKLQTPNPNKIPIESASLDLFGRTAKLPAVRRSEGQPSCARVRTLLPMILALLASLSAHADSMPQVEWQRGFGGTNADILAGLLSTSDGHFILVGSSFSGATGNKTSTNSGDYDGWIIGLDANGNKLWDWSYGGTNTDTLRTVQQTTNGEVVV